MQPARSALTRSTPAALAAPPASSSPRTAWRRGPSALAPRRPRHSPRCSASRPRATGASMQWPTCPALAPYRCQAPSWSSRREPPLQARRRSPRVPGASIFVSPQPNFRSIDPCSRGGARAAHDNPPRGSGTPGRAGVEVGCRLVPLSPRSIGTQALPGPRTVASPAGDSTRELFVAVSAAPPCAESADCDGSTLRHLLRARRAQGPRHRLSPLARGRGPAPPGGADLRHHDARALRQRVDWLTTAGCTHVAMESTGVYWRPVYHLLEGSFELFLV